MRVYRFLNATYGIQSIEKRKLKISNIMELNDPFEFFCADLSDKTFRLALRNTKEEMAKSRGIMCFSRKWWNPLLWSHYSDKHRGLCLGFEIPDEHLIKMNYVKSRIQVNREPDEALIKKFLTTKFKHWHYEEEYRSFVALEDRDTDGNFYADFSDKLQLKEIIVGASSDLSRRNIQDALEGISENIETYKARAAFKKFEVVRNRDPSLWM